MKKLKITILAAFLALGINAQADGLYDIIFSDGGANVGYGQIDIEGGYAVSGYFNVTAGLAVGNYSLYAAGGTGTYISPITSPSGAFFYDNAAYLSSNPQYPVTNPFLDNNGFLFRDINNNEVNLWAPADNGTYAFDAYINNAYIDPSGIIGSSTITPAPEPSSLAVFAIMLVPAGALLYQRRIKSGN